MPWGEQQVVSQGFILDNFTIWRLKEGLIPFSRNNRVNFYGEKKYNKGFCGVYFLKMRGKNLKSDISSL